jgi:hypothetical protein
MPYEQQYTHVVEDGGVAYEFVFYPSFGWRWVVAPWVLGVGPHPYFAHGPVHFAWYARRGSGRTRWCTAISKNPLGAGGRCGGNR